MHISSRSIVIVPSEFEGDGMTVIESLSNGNPILLANNPDLRRFDLPDKNYFENLEDLIGKIKEAQRLGVERFRIDTIQKESILRERDPIIVGQKWISLFNKMGK
jgi:glycosyltransferase involved in cell wall biosynthesis